MAWSDHMVQKVGKTEGSLTGTIRTGGAKTSAVLGSVVRVRQPTVTVWLGG